MSSAGPPAPTPSSAARPASADVPDGLVRETLHHVNNVAARLLLRCEMALESGDPAVREAALRSAVAAAEDLGGYVREVRARLRARRPGGDVQD